MKVLAFLEININNLPSSNSSLLNLGYCDQITLILPLLVFKACGRLLLLSSFLFFSLLFFQKNLSKTENKGFERVEKYKKTDTSDLLLFSLFWLSQKIPFCLTIKTIAFPLPSHYVQINHCISFFLQGIDLHLILVFWDVGKILLKYCFNTKTSNRLQLIILF